MAGKRNVVASEAVRTVELEVTGPVELTLRIEVMRALAARRFWTRVWRQDLYRVTPFSGRKQRRAADETLLVEDALFSRRVSARTAATALRQTVALIERQLGISVGALD